MNINKLLLPTLMVTAVTSGCSTSISDMSCSDTIVTDTVLEISRDEVGGQVFYAYTAKDLGDIPLMLATRNKSYSEILALDVDVNSKTYIAAKDVTTKVLNKLRLEAIRLQGRDQMSQKLTCIANLVSDGQAEIDYTAQLTETGDVYVEVFGLE